MKRNKYRLRLNRMIIGYAEQTTDGLLIKNCESNIWLKSSPEYNQVDKFTGIQDKFHRDLYENDLVNYRINHKEQMRKGVVLEDSKTGDFLILDLETNHITRIFIRELCLFEAEKVEIYSHLFNQPELENLIVGNHGLQ